MKTTDILRLVHRDLKPYVEDDLGGRLSVSGTYVETLEVLTTGPRGFLCIMEWLGEDSFAEDNQPYIGVVRFELGIYVAVNPGINGGGARPGEGLWLSESGRTLLDRVEQVRARVREIRLEHDETHSREFDYRSCRQVLTPDGLPLAAYRMEFGLIHSLHVDDYRNLNL